MTSTVLILGAAGRIGQVLTAALAEAGWNVRAQSRGALPAPLRAHAQVAHVHCDAFDSTAIRSAAHGVEVVIHALGAPYAQWARLGMPLADAAIDAARVSGALLMFPGNVYNFGSELPPWLTLSTPERGDHPKARIRIETETRMASVPGLDSVVIRAGDFFGGAGRGSWFDLALASRLKSGRFIYPGSMNAVHSWAYLPDLAQVFVKVAAQRSQLRGHHRFHFAGHALTGEQMLHEMQAVLGRALRGGGLPWGLMRLVAPLVPQWRELLSVRYLWERPWQLDDSALRALIGVPPHTALPQALAAALTELEALPASAPLALG